MTTSNSTISTRGHRFKLQTSQFKRYVAKNQFCNRVVCNWNNLPDSIVATDSIFTSRKHIALHISKRHCISTTPLRTLVISFISTFIYCDQYCTATIYSAARSARGTHIVYVFPNKQSMDEIRNEYIRGTAQVGKFGEKTREARLRWYGHLRRKDDGYIGRRMLRMELPRKRKRRRSKRRFMDVVKEDMAEVEVTEEDTVDRRNWRKKIRCGDP